ncbi:hypothetical protein [Parapedobacter sp. DT-150]|uniref:hypothetical protein n=1 Tax=Parapedobacter sp. DT-150 TaxID=3396162 RepID=UPI003F1DD4C4
MSKTEKIKLSFSQLCWHYSIVPFLLIVPLLEAWDLLNYYMLRKYDGVRNPSELVTVSLAFVALSILFYFIQKRRLRFREFNIPCTNEAFDKALKKTSEELKWKIVAKRKGYVRAYRDWNWSASWGELITIKREGDRILINSICNPEAIFISVISYGWNKKNIRTFIDNLSNQSADAEVISVDNR